MKKHLLAFCFLLCIVRAGAQIDTEFWMSTSNFIKQSHEFNYSFKILPTEFDKKLLCITNFPAVKSIKTDSIIKNTVRNIFWINKDFGSNLNSLNEKSDIVGNFAMRVVTSSKCAISTDSKTAFDYDAISLKGRNALGLEFYVPMQNVYETGIWLRGILHKPSFKIIATQNKTVVEITPSKPIVGHPAYRPFQVSLNAGETYIAESTSYLASGRLEGSYITSNKPIAVNIIDDYVSSENHVGAGVISDQLVPVDKLGTEYVAVKAYDFGRDTKPNELFVLAVNDATDVYLKGEKTPYCTLNKGEQKRILFDDQTMYVRSSSPVYVLQIASNFESYRGNLLPPISRCTGVNKYQMYCRDNHDGKFYADYFRFIVPIEIMDYFEVNGKPFVFNPDWVKPISGLEDKYIAVKFSSEEIFKYINSPLDSFPILVNRKGKFMPSHILSGETKVGMRFQSDFVNSGGYKTEKTLCWGDTLLFDYEPSQGNYLWSTGDTTLGIIAKETGTYWKKTTNGGCVTTDSIQLNVNLLPEISLGSDSDFCAGNQHLLRAPSKLSGYKWQNGDSTSTFLVKETGTYFVKITDSKGCSNSDTVLFAVHPLPKIELKSQTFCDLQNCRLEVKVDSLEQGRWGYSGDGRMHFSSSVSMITRASVSKPGDYKLWFDASTEWGCSASDTAQFSFYTHPQSFFTLDSSKCYGQNVDVIYTGTLGPQAEYHWDFDDCIVLNGQNQGPFTVALGTAATTKLFKLWTSEHGCASDTSIKRFSVKPTFGFSTDSLKACNGENVKFKAWSIKPNITYHWTFGSLGTSDEQNPTFPFKQGGQFPISLTLTENNGCKNADVMKGRMQVFHPIAQTDIDPFFCYGDTLAVRYTGTPKTGVQLHWDFSSVTVIKKDSDSSYLLDISKSKTKTLGLYVVENGCESELLSQPFKRKPHPSFISDQTWGCVPFTLNFGADPKYEGETYQWAMDGKTWKDNQTKYTFTHMGKYDLKLDAYSNDGCEQSQTYPAYFHAYEKPKAAFHFNPHTTLSDNALITFNNQSSGAVKYKWIFGGEETSSETNPTHFFSNEGEINIKLFAENEFGCTDSCSDILNIVKGVAVANAISPHSNVEKNRIFYPFPQGMPLSNYELKIFNRWGNLVFSSNEPQKGWDGSINGETAKAGAFVWTAVYIDAQGNERKNAGTLLLVE